MVALGDPDRGALEGRAARRAGVEARQDASEEVAGGVLIRLVPRPRTRPVPPEGVHQPAARRREDCTGSLRAHVLAHAECAHGCGDTNDVVVLEERNRRCAWTLTNRPVELGVECEEEAVDITWITAMAC